MYIYGIRTGFVFSCLVVVCFVLVWYSPGRYELDGITKSTPGPLALLILLLFTHDTYRFLVCVYENLFLVLPTSQY